MGSPPPSDLHFGKCGTVSAAAPHRIWRRCVGICRSCNIACSSASPLWVERYSPAAPHPHSRLRVSPPSPCHCPWLGIAALLLWPTIGIQAFLWRTVTIERMGIYSYRIWRSCAGPPPIFICTLLLRKTNTFCSVPCVGIIKQKTRVFLELSFSLSLSFNSPPAQNHFLPAIYGPTNYCIAKGCGSNLPGVRRLPLLHHRDWWIPENDYC